MNALPPFLNIHSHRKPSAKDEFVVRNAYLHYPNSSLSANYFLSFGIHPWFAESNSVNNSFILETLAAQQSCLAIGECGIDRINGPNPHTQIEAFNLQIDVANRLKKPMILHLVKSYSDILQHAHSIKVAWLVHGFRGNEQQANALIDKGARLSFGAAILQDEKLWALLAKMPLDRLYLETDVSNERIQTIYHSAASARNMSVDSLRKAIWTNFERDFNFSYGQ